MLATHRRGDRLCRVAAFGESWKAGVVSPLGSESICDGARLAQPDEAWNYKTGDGIEKDILPANIWLARRSVAASLPSLHASLTSCSEGWETCHPNEKIELTIQPGRVELRLAGHAVSYASSKGLTTNVIRNPHIRRPRSGLFYEVTEKLTIVSFSVTSFTFSALRAACL